MNTIEFTHFKFSICFSQPIICGTKNCKTSQAKYQKRNGQTFNKCQKIYVRSATNCIHWQLKSMKRIRKTIKYIKSPFVGDIQSTRFCSKQTKTARSAKWYQSIGIYQMHQNYVVSRLYQLGLKYFKVSSNVNSCQRLLDILNYVIFSILQAKHRFFFRVTDSIQNVIIILLCVCVYILYMYQLWWVTGIFFCTSFILFTCAHLCWLFSFLYFDCSSISMYI